MISLNKNVTQRDAGSKSFSKLKQEAQVITLAKFAVTIAPPEIS
jgi:hypothetical protein